MQLATDTIEAVSSALKTGFADKGKKVVVWADKSDYKDFIRMYIVSDYFKGMSDKERLGEVYSIFESHGAKSLIRKISLCIAMTQREYNQEFGEGVWLGVWTKFIEGWSHVQECAGWRALAAGDRF